MWPRRGALYALQASQAHYAAEPDNRASLRVLARCGFTGLRGSDEDGRLVMVRPLPVAAP